MVERIFMGGISLVLMGGYVRPLRSIKIDVQIDMVVLQGRNR